MMNRLKILISAHNSALATLSVFIIHERNRESVLRDFYINFVS